MYTKSVDVYTVGDFMENGKVAYESWGAHYMGAEQNKNLIAELENYSVAEIYRITSNGLKTGNIPVKIEKCKIQNPFYYSEEDAFILSALYDDRIKLLLDITHIPYIRTERGICFLTGLVLRLDDCWNYVYKRCGEVPTVEYLAKAVEEYKQYMEENEKADTECAKGFLISADEEEQIRQSEEYKQYMKEHKEDKDNE